VQGDVEDPAATRGHGHIVDRRRAWKHEAVDADGGTGRLGEHADQNRGRSGRLFLLALGGGRRFLCGGRGLARVRLRNYGRLGAERPTAWSHQAVEAPHGQGDQRHDEDERGDERADREAAALTRVCAALAFRGRGLLAPPLLVEALLQSREPAGLAPLHLVRAQRAFAVHADGLGEQPDEVPRVDVLREVRVATLFERSEVLLTDVGELRDVREVKSTALTGASQQLSQALRPAATLGDAALVRHDAASAMGVPARNAAATRAASLAFSSSRRVLTSTVRPPESLANSASRKGVVSRPLMPRLASSASARSLRDANSG